MNQRGNDGEIHRWYDYAIVQKELLQDSARNLSVIQKAFEPFGGTADVPRQEQAVREQG
jgi:hypothetical protein